MTSTERMARMFAGARFPTVRATRPDGADTLNSPRLNGDKPHLYRRHGRWVAAAPLRSNVETMARLANARIVADRLNLKQEKPQC